jgi:hypothetical protein
MYVYLLMGQRHQTDAPYVVCAYSSEEAAETQRQRWESRHPNSRAEVVRHTVFDADDRQQDREQTG